MWVLSLALIDSSTLFDVPSVGAIGSSVLMGRFIDVTGATEMG